MSYNLMSGNVNFVGNQQGTIEDVVDTHSNQTINGQKTFSNLSSSANIHVVGNISASLNISASAFYANGVLVGGGGAITALNNKAENRLVTIGSTTTELDGEANLSFAANQLNVTGNVLVSNIISGSNITGSVISGSAFYGNWAGSNILGSQVQKNSGGGIGDSSGLTLTTTGVTPQNSPGGSARVLIDESGIKYATLTNIFAQNAAVTSAGSLSNTHRVLIAGGTGTITSNANFNFYNGNSTLTVTGAMSASSNLDVGGTLDVAGNSVFLGDVEIGGTLSGGSPLNISGAVNFISSSFNSSGSWVHTGSFFQSGSGNTFSIMDVVGIGTTSPTATLEISSSNDPQFKISHPAAGSNARFTMAANGDLTINPNGSTTIDSSLTINGNTILGDNSADAFTINGTAVTIPNGLNFDSNTLFISSSNDRVGIGTITPISKLDVSGAIAITAESLTPSQPLDGQGYLYSKNDGKLYWRSFDLTETNLSLTSADIGTTTIKTAFLSTAPSFAGGDTNEFFIKWSDGTTHNQPDLRSNNQYFLFPGGGFLSKVTAFGSTVTDSSDSNPFTNDLRVKVYVWDANDTSDIAEGNFATGYVAVASVSGSATDIKATDGGGQKRHRASYSVNINHQISASVGIAVSVQGVDAGNNNSKGFNALNLSFHFTDI